MVNGIVEEEIDLRDYLRVIWKNRSLILAIVLVSLITSGIYSFFVQQDEYLSEARLSYISNQKISLTDAVEILKSLSMLSNMKVENIKNTNQINIQLRGNNPEIMKKYFEENINMAVDELNRKSLERSQRDQSRSENLSIIYRGQREEIKEEIRKKLAREADLEIRRLKNLSIALARLEGSEKQIDMEILISELESIKEGRVSSITAQNMIRSDPDLNLLNLKLTSINNKLVDLENNSLGLEKLDSQVVELTKSPTDPQVIGPKRSLNMAIAAVLGLFIGIFAAFFKNYLEGSASK